MNVLKIKTYILSTLQLNAIFLTANGFRDPEKKYSETQL